MHLASATLREPAGVQLTGHRLPFPWHLSEAVIAACMAVHTELGPGLLESVYEAALKEELTARGIPFQSQPRFDLFYKGRQLDQIYRPDLIVEGRPSRTPVLPVKSRPAPKAYRSHE